MVEAVADGATIPQAARALAVHEQTVRKFVARFRTEGFAGLADRPRGGRPARLTEADLVAVEARLDADAATGARTWTLAQLAAWLADRPGDGRHAGPPRASGSSAGASAGNAPNGAPPTSSRDPDRQEEAAADLALLPFCRGSPIWA